MKKGISLIVLVITIIIIIILAGAVILNLSENNPIDRAHAAAVMSEQSDLNDGLTMFLGTVAGQQAAGYSFHIKSGATAVSADAVDANDVKIGAGYYNLADVSVTCGSYFGTGADAVVEEFPKDADTLVTTIGIANARYAKSADFTVVMNKSGNVKLVKTESLTATP